MAALRTAQMSGGIVAGIQEAGVKPNRATWSTLLKCLDANSKEQNIARTMDLISSMDEPMDEVLLSAVAEAQVRVRGSSGRCDAP